MKPPRPGEVHGLGRVTQLSNHTFPEPSLQDSFCDAAVAWEAHEDSGLCGRCQTHYTGQVGCSWSASLLSEEKGAGQLKAEESGRKTGRSRQGSLKMVFCPCKAWQGTQFTSYLKETDINSWWILSFALRALKYLMLEILHRILENFFFTINLIMKYFRHAKRLSECNESIYTTLSQRVTGIGHVGGSVS